MLQIDIDNKDDSFGTFRGSFPKRNKTARVGQASSFEMTLIKGGAETIQV